MPWLELDESLPEFPLHVLRAAAAEGEGDSYSYQLDYTVLSVAYLTLGLILIVELIRHRLDVSATGRPFFKSVLDRVYQELSTLGIVEFFIFILHKYYENLDAAQEQVFANVHYTLFLTALFNAVECVLLAVLSTRKSYDLWVRTEQLEVGHYVEIREEFQRVDRLLYGDNDSIDRSSSRAMSRRRSALSLQSEAEVPFEFNRHGILGSFESMMIFLRRPWLYRKHQKLLVQIRFHELRVHFLKSNNLPLKFKVSDYLKRSELHVLVKLVHITTFAWLILTGGVLLIFFLMGIVVFVTEDLTKVGLSLTWIFLGIIVLFVFLSLIIFNKMKAIFLKIMRQRLTTEEQNGRNSRKKQITSQVALFWGGNPNFIRVIIQFMQFGFAIALSIFTVFWNDINVEEAPMSAGSMLAIVVSCNAAFVLIMAQVLPRYTLCTSLGQLVNQQRLQETFAQYKLEEAQRKQELRAKFECDDGSVIYDESDDASRSSSLIMHPVEVARKVISNGLRIGRQSERSKTLEDIDFSKASPHTDALSEDQSREQRLGDRRNRRKSVSDGIARMRLFDQSTVSALSDRVSETAELKQPDQPRQAHSLRDFRGRQKSLSGSEDITKMRRSPSFESLLITQLVQTETKDLRKSLNVQPPEQRIQARRNRMKSLSDGVTLMRQVMKEEDEEEEREKGTDARGLAGSIDFSAVPSARSQRLRRERQRSVSASAAIQQMRDSSFSGEITQSSAEIVDAQKRRPPWSRQSSTGVPRLEPLVEGVPAKHPDQSLPVMLSVDDDRDEDVHPDVTSIASDDKSTMGTSTLGDGRSDADDIPDVDPDVRETCVAEPEPRPGLSEIGRAYFESERYRMISVVFGTMTCFYFVGLRVEALLIATCTMTDNKSTWTSKLGVIFWMETCWLSCFILAACIVMFLFRPGQIFTNRERVVFLSAVIDMTLSSVCLALLMVAESRRCCPEAEQRLLAGSRSLEAACEVDPDCCPSYGKRFYGGLGSIEPITSIIALRIFRSPIAEKIIAYLDDRYKWSDLDVAEGRKSESPHPLSPLFSTEEAHRKKSMDHETGTAVELWTHALALYSEIVEQYGEFSGELLRAMLGLEIGEVTRRDGLDAADTSLKEDAGPPAVFSANKKAEGESFRRASMSVGKRFSQLTPEAQSIILSGKLGKSVRSTRIGGASPTFMHKMPRQEGEEDTGELATPRHLQLLLGRKETPVANVTFELDSIDGTAPTADQTSSSFLAPDARLIRNMRRCDRKLLPLLDVWSSVDVVITKWEIVYLDASDVDDMQGAGYSEEEISSIESIRQAVVATKGGKGLRLRDVALGRKVVGRLELSAVDAIHVERIMPPGNGEYIEQFASDDKKEIPTEFWKKTGSDSEAALLSRTSRWARVKEDRLRIHSIHDTLVLRFYSDLDDSECHHERCVNEQESHGPIFKNNAFQWCQTIVRLCGINQLKQKLPHFGDDDANELRDYLIVVDSKNILIHDSPRHMRRKSVVDLLNHARLHQRRTTLAHVPEISEIPRVRASSFGESLLPSNGLRRPSQALRRLCSTGDVPRGGILDVSSFQASARPSESTNQDAPSGHNGPDMV